LRFEFDEEIPDLVVRQFVPGQVQGVLQVTLLNAGLAVGRNLKNIVFM
jgi:hypothetical protein